MSEKESINILILSAGRRVELTKCFKAARDRLKIGGKVVAMDCSELAPALYFADARVIAPRISEGDAYIYLILCVIPFELGKDILVIRAVYVLAI